MDPDLDPQHWFDIASLTSGAGRRRNRREAPVLAAAAAVPSIFIRIGDPDGGRPIQLPKKVGTG
jgi:hypothetical protein